MAKSNKSKDLPRQCKGCEKVIHSRFKRHEGICKWPVKGDRWRRLDKSLKELSPKAIAVNKKRGKTDGTSRTEKELPRCNGKFCAAE